MKRAKAFILTGLPASGKSTKARQLCDVIPNTIRVNKDLLREMVDFGQYTIEREERINRIEYDIFEVALHRGSNVVVDDCNLNPKHIEEFQKRAKLFNAEVEIINMMDSCTLAECIKRDKDREKSVGAEVIKRMYNKYLRPAMTTDPEPENDDK